MTEPIDRPPTATAGPGGSRAGVGGGPRPVASFPGDAPLPLDVVSYGPGAPDEGDLRLLGHVEGKRVLVLGAGAGQAVVALARQGARAIAVDPSAAHLDQARALCDQEEVRAELHQSDLAELAFIRADTVDAAVAVMSLAAVDDLDRVFRQVHRVLRPESPLAISLPHPASAAARGGSYFDRNPRIWEAAGATGVEHPRTIGDVFTSLTRANFRVDTVLEPEPPTGGEVRWEGSGAAPATLVVRAKKEGT